MLSDRFELCHNFVWRISLILNSIQVQVWIRSLKITNMIVPCTDFKKIHFCSKEIFFCCWCVWCVKCTADCWWDKHIHCLLMCDSYSHVKYRILQTCTPRRKVVVCIVGVIIHHFCWFQPLKLFNPAGLAHAYNYCRIDTWCIFYLFFLNCRYTSDCIACCTGYSVYCVLEIPVWGVDVWTETHCTID